MSNNESFIDEVTEEVRRDRLFHYFRRYGWIGVVVVLLLVGGAAWSELQQARAAARAQALGDAILTALDADNPEGRAEALAAVAPEGPAAAVSGMLRASALQQAGEMDAAAGVLETVAANPGVPALYRDLARLKAAMADPDLTPEGRIATLEPLAVPGNPYRLLALEQVALAQLEAGERDQAVATLRMVVEDAAVTSRLRDRAQALIVGLGAPLDPIQAPVNQAGGEP